MTTTQTYDREHTTCGHRVPSHHETTWGTEGNVFCSAKCMGEYMTTTTNGDEMTRTKYLPTRRLLDSGESEAFLNHTGQHVWSVDIFYLEDAPTTDPWYHAFYDNEQAARDDFDSWKAWPEPGQS